MFHRSMISTAALAAGLALAAADAQAFDQSKYPDWTGAWRRIATPGVTGQPGFDQTKRLGPPQQAPLTRKPKPSCAPAWTRKGGKATTRPICIPPGPCTMNPMAPWRSSSRRRRPMFIEHIHNAPHLHRRPRLAQGDADPGRLCHRQVPDTDNDGKFDTLEVETRYMRPARFRRHRHALHADNKTVVKERIYLDKPIRT
jgi:hypothetical protein